MSIDKRFKTISSSNTTKLTLLMAFATINNEFAEILSEQLRVILKQDEEILQLKNELRDATSRPQEPTE